MYTTRKDCRACGGSLTSVLNLGSIYPSNFLKDGEEIEKAPLELVQCDKCGLVQLRDTVTLDEMYRTYWYKSGLNPKMVGALRDVVTSALALVTLEPGDSVLDIGANDGTMLKMLPDYVYKIGVDPATNLANEAKNSCDLFINDYFPTSIRVAENVKLITAIAMFYDLEDPMEFLREIKAILHPEGLFVVQFTDLLSMLDTTAFDNICFHPDEFVLGSNKPIKDVTVGETVVDMFGKPALVRKTFSRNYTGDLFNIKGKYLLPILCTDEHPILVVEKSQYRFDGGQLKPDADVKTFSPIWKSAKEISKDDLLLVPKLKQTSRIEKLDLKPYGKFDDSHHRRGLGETTIDEEFAWILGLYVAEGHQGRSSNGQSHVCFTLHEKEVEYYERIEKFFESVGYKTRKYHSKLSKAVNVQVSWTALANFLVHLCGKGALEKRIPEFILYGPREIKVAFLSGLFAGDGWVNNNNKVELHTSSKTLTLQVQLLLASVGVMFGIVELAPRTSEIRGQVVRGKKSWLIRGTSNNISKVFGLNHPHENKQHYFQDDNYMYVPVTRIEKQTYSGPVFNLETESHTYCMSNLVTHNCHEHLEYYSVNVVANMLKQVGLRIVDLEYNDVNGSSVRAYIRHADYGQVDEVVTDTLAYEQSRLNAGAIAQFVERIEKAGKVLTTYLSQLTPPVAVLGASTKGNTLLQYFGIDNTVIHHAAEVNKDKFGLHTIGTNIPIISEVDSLILNPTAYLVLPWHFIQNFTEKFNNYLSNGGKLIVPLPRPAIYYKQGGRLKWTFLDEL